jgi:hypothetical protein
MSKRFGGMLLIVMLFSACNAGAAATPEPDRVGTRVAEELAVSQTLTAVAKAANPAVTEVAEVEPSAAPAPTVTEEPTVVAPTVAAPKPPTPTKTAAPEQADPFVPGGGDPKGLIGKMLLPGYGGSSEQVDLPVFTQQIVFQLLVHDPNIGSQDGAGINSVDITIFDPNGAVVQTRTEFNAAYCAFGNDQPACPAWKFAEHGNQWPTGIPVCRGQGYQAIMIVHAQNGDNEGALWRFNFDIEGDYPPC